ncbi:heme-dependent oxidative N-demethylase family protein [Hyphomonas sp.]|uniref:heme-dependent oxidative N-demethylase family protein n=1 Tax=Hyphomonas sp. TaxID=87 RepID=UPI00391A880F
MRTPPYLPFLNGPLSLAPGLKPIEASHWLDPDTEKDVWLDDKRTLMRKRRRDVFAARPGTEEAMAEAAEQVLAFSGSRARGDWPTPLEKAASAVSDDLCLMMREGYGFWRLEAASLCAPTFWRLDEKLGEPLAGLHGPVPGANPDMVGRVRRMFDALRPGQVLERFNWTVQPGPERFTPSQEAYKRLAGILTEEGALAALWLRVERQTISKLPQTGAVLFTIRVAIDPLQAALDGPGHAEAFEAAWDGIDPVLADYKGWPHYERLVRAALAEVGRSR